MTLLLNIHNSVRTLVEPRTTAKGFHTTQTFSVSMFPGRTLRVNTHEHVIKSREETRGIYAFLRHLPEIMALPLRVKAPEVCAKSRA